LSHEGRTEIASIVKEILIEAPAEKVWAAFRDFGEVQRVVPGLLAGCELDGDARIVTFYDGRVARELLVTIDDDSRRLVYAEVNGRFITRNASWQVFREGEDRSRFVWIQDLLPNELAGLISGNMDRAMPVIKRTLESSPVPD
jgi:carbon monoxide dehydrogenase subunit G